jgi:hypothetical protein
VFELGENDHVAEAFATRRLGTGQAADFPQAGRCLGERRRPLRNRGGTKRKPSGSEQERELQPSHERPITMQWLTVDS